MKKSPGYLLLFAALALAQFDFANQSFGAEQAIKKKANCKAVGGKLGPNPYSTGEYPYLCIYPDKYDRACKRKIDETAYYDIEQKKCVSELLCDLEGIC